MFVGIKGAVLAIDRETGATAWETNLKGSDFVNVALQNDDLYAACRGRLYRLDPATGAILWVNGLAGLGIVTIAGAPQNSVGAAAKKRRDGQSAAVAAAAT